jgi:cell division septation protein DedD
MSANDLISLLVQKLGIDEQEAQGMVSDWIQHLGSELSTSGKANLPGIGTLLLDDGKIQFELDPGFAMEVNYRYLGMKPIVVSDDINIGLKEPEAEDDLEVESVDEEVVQADALEEGSREDTIEDTEEALVDADEEFEVTEVVEDEVAETAEVEKAGEESGDDDEVNDKEEEVETEMGEVDDEDLAEEPDELEEPEELDEATKERIARRTAALRSTRKEKKSINLPLWAGVGVIIIAAIVAGWQFYLRPVVQNPAVLVGSSENMAPTVSDEDSLLVEIPEVPPTTMEEVPEVKDTVVSAPLNVTSAKNIPADQPKYGLMGVVDSRANDGYTLVLFSLSNRQNAMEKYQLYKDQGYRSLISPVNSERYGLMWRVSIGQFATVNDALSAASELPTDLANDYFITKI